jgi:hypothetical protein
VEIFVDPRGTLLSLKADRGVIGVRSGARVYMPMRSCWIVTAGPLRIQVEPQEAHGANRRYGITVVAPARGGRHRSRARCRVRGTARGRTIARYGLGGGAAYGAAAVSERVSHWEATGDVRPQAEVLLQIGIAAERLGQTADAVASYKGSADIYHRLQDRPNLAFALQYLGGGATR